MNFFIRQWIWFVDDQTVQQQQENIDISATICNRRRLNKYFASCSGLYCLALYVPLNETTDGRSDTTVISSSRVIIEISVYLFSLLVLIRSTLQYFIHKMLLQHLYYSRSVVPPYSISVKIITHKSIL